MRRGVVRRTRCCSDPEGRIEERVPSHRAVTAHERIVAAENEAAWLDELLDRAIDALREHGEDTLADALRREQIEDQITPSKVRPLIYRPLSSNEIPVRIEYRNQPRRW